MNHEALVNIIREEASRLEKDQPLRAYMYSAVREVFDAVGERVQVSDFDVKLLKKVSALGSAGRPVKTEVLSKQYTMSNAAIRYHLRKNIKRGLLDHPGGVRKGWGLTLAGKKLLQDIAERETAA